MTSIQLSKKSLRNQIRLCLRNMTIEDRKLQSEIITRKVIQHPRYKSAERISIYLSLDHEVDTNEILKDIFKRNKMCFIPRYDSKSHFMQMIRLKSLDEVENLPLTSWNIRQHAEGGVEENDEDALNSGGLDLIITPGLGFSGKSGQRLGSGKGYYDNFFRRLSNNQHDIKPFYSIGIGFKQQILSEIPTESHDVPLDEIITSFDHQVSS